MGKKRIPAKAKSYFLSHLHHIHWEVAFLNVMNKDKGKFSKIWLLVPIWLPKRSLSVAHMAYMTLLLGNILIFSPPSPKRGKSLRMSLGILTIHKKSPTCKKSALWLNLQSIWNGVPPRHTHGENRYSKSTGLIGLSLERNQCLCQLKVGRKSLTCETVLDAEV